MKNNIYTLVIKTHNIVREFDKKAVVEAIEKLFGEEKASDVRNWLKATIADDTYSTNDFAIHYLRF